MKKQRSGFGLFAAAFFVSLSILLLTMGTVMSITVKTEEQSSAGSSDLSVRDYTPKDGDAFTLLIITGDGEEQFSLLTFDPMGVELRLTLLPRELWCGGKTLAQNFAYAGGGEALNALVTAGIAADRWLRITDRGAVNLIDAFGGMEWEFSEPLRSDRLDIPVGRHLLDGETVLMLMKEKDSRLPDAGEMAASLIGQRFTEQLLNSGDRFFQLLTANSDGNISQFDYQQSKKMLRWYLTHEKRALTLRQVNGERAEGKLLPTEKEARLLGMTT